MIKATMTKGKKPFVVLGLSFENLDRLRKDAPEGFIQIDGSKLGIAFDIVIFAAKDDQGLVDMVSGGIGPTTIVHRDEPTH